MSSEKGVVPKQVLLELCYAAVQKAAFAHGSYDADGQAQLAEALTDRIVKAANGGDPADICTNDVQTYGYLCAIFKEIEKFIPLVRQFDVHLFASRLGVEGKTNKEFQKL
jgi:hypothetical protein